MIAADGLLLVEALASRMAHDLAGAVGGVNNGIELLQDVAGVTDSETLAHISACGEVAAARLAFYRMAYGRAGNDLTSVPDLRELAIRFVAAGGRCRFEWPMPPIMATPQPGEGRLLLLCSEVALDALPRGGTVTVLLDEGDGGIVEASGETGGAVALPDMIQAALSDETPPGAITPRTAHAVLARVFAASLGKRLNVAEAQDGALAIRIVPD